MEIRNKAKQAMLKTVLKAIAQFLFVIGWEWREMMAVDNEIDWNIYALPILQIRVFKAKQFINIFCQP